MYDAQTRASYNELFKRAEAQLKDKLARELAPVLAKHPVTAQSLKAKEK